MPTRRWDWAQRGLAKYPDRPWQLAGLRDFLGERLRSQGDVEASLELFWDAFVTSPSLTGYRRLLDEVTDDRASWSAQCFDRLRGDASNQAGGLQRLQARPSDALVDVLMFEGDSDGARAVAQTRGCDARKLMALAWERESDHPSDAIDVYEPEVFSLIDPKQNHAHTNAADLMARIERLAAAAGTSDRFRAVLARARTEHRAKRDLKKHPRCQGWPDPRSTT